MRTTGTAAFFGVGAATTFRATGRLTDVVVGTAFFFAVLTMLLTGLAVFLAGLATFRGRFPIARVETVARRAPRRRVTDLLAGRRKAFGAVFARVLADLFDFLDFAGRVARAGPAARRPFARLAFALAMTLLVRSPLW